MTKAEETGINGFHFYIIGVFFFDFPGQSAEVGSMFAGRAVGINSDLHHEFTSFSLHHISEADKLVAGHDHFVQIFLTALAADLIFHQPSETEAFAA
jgi:hypothetical protein